MSEELPSRPDGALSRLPRLGFAPWRIGDWLTNLPGNRYSRRVALLKLALPAIGATLLLMVVAWPRLAPLFDRLRFAAIDLREARELRMVNPRFAGTDRIGRPYVVTAALGRQVPGRDDVMSLQGPRADLKAHNGAPITITAESGVYQTPTQMLDLFSNVTITHEDGTRFVTDSARFDAVNNAGEGHDHVDGHGPRGDLSADGFRLIDKGAIIIFTGHANLLLKSASQSGDQLARAPEAVPPPIAQAAAQVEAKAAPQLAAMPAKPAPHQAARSPAAAPAKSTPHHAAKPPSPAKPAAKKPT